MARETEQDGRRQVLALSAEELAESLGVSLRHVRRMNATGKLPRPVKLGRSVRWVLSGIDQWLAAGAPDRRRWEQTKEL